MLKNPFQYSISTWFIVTFLIAIGMTVGPATWFFIGIIECMFCFCLCNYLSDNLPDAIESLMKANALRADGTTSTKREKIEASERVRFKRNISILILVFFAATNIGLLALRVDRVFEGQTYIVDSPEVQARPGRRIPESQLAWEIGNRQLAATGQEPVGASVVGTTRFAVLLVAIAIWILAAVLIPVGYLGMLRTMALEASGRSEYYRSYDFAGESR